MSQSPAGTGWYNSGPRIQGWLCDITGVLYDSGEGGGVAIPGSAQAIEKLKSAGVPIRFCTNETQCTKDYIATKLNCLGFNLDPSEIFPPAPAVCKVAKENGLRPHLLVHPDALPEFSGVDQTEPNCVVIGDAAEHFSYGNLNKAFQVLLSMKKPYLISMGEGKYYKETDGLKLDVGVFMKALQYASDCEVEIIGKPSKAFFHSALKDMDVLPENAIMIGDDIISDVGGAQACGIRGLQVRTGKYRPDIEPHPLVSPDGYVDNLAQAVDLYLANK